MAGERDQGAITAEVFFHWASVRFHGPNNLHVGAAERPEQDRKVYPGA